MTTTISITKDHDQISVTQRASNLYIIEAWNGETKVEVYLTANDIKILAGTIEGFLSE